MFRTYDQQVTSATQSAARSRALQVQQEDPQCCCCRATSVIIACNTGLFLFAIAIMMIGFFINNEVSGWKLSLFDMLGNLCVFTGAFLLVVSVVGIMAARTLNTGLMFAYFMLELLVVTVMCLSVVYATVETDHIASYLQQNWDSIEEIICGKKAVCDLPSYEQSNKIIHDYFHVLVGVGFAAILVQFTTLCSAMRLLGVRALAISCLVTLGLLGLAEVGLAIVTQGDVNRPTTWLLLACAAVQVVCATCGICGFKSLNRECIKWAFIILFVSSSGLVYVVISTYLWMRDERTEHPEKLLLLFAIALVSVFFMYSSLLFGAIFYCKRRSAFFEADRAAEVHGQFSDCATRRRPSRRPGKVREYNARSAL